MRLWPDTEQPAVIDASGGVPLPHGNHRRAWLPSSVVRIEPAHGTVLPGAFAYVNRRGVLHDRADVPRAHPGRRPLLTELLLRSSRLREPFGVAPEEFCTRARAGRRLCARGTALFAQAGPVASSGPERYVRVQRAAAG